MVILFIDLPHPSSYTLSQYYLYHNPKPMMRNIISGPPGSDQHPMIGGMLTSTVLLRRHNIKSPPNKGLDVSPVQAEAGGPKSHRQTSCKWQIFSLASGFIKAVTQTRRRHQMLTITDLGCDRHNRRQLTLGGVEAEIMGDVLYNLPNDGDSHTFICEYGHTHRISFTIQLEKLYRLSDMFSKKRGRSGKAKPGQARANRGNSYNLMKG
jgi:hypothetical protein